jgi:hypothetical protein
MAKLPSNQDEKTFSSDLLFRLFMKLYGQKWLLLLLKKEGIRERGMNVN